MLIKEIELVNYTNYEYANIFLHPRVNILIGDNAQGKSNFIDAIFFLGLARSHRHNQDLALIHWGQDYFRLKGQIQNLQGDLIIEHAVKKGRKVIKINGSPITKLNTLIGQFNTIVFTPDDLILIKGGPDLRRRFLNRKIIQLNPFYYETSLCYQRVLLQRNNLLKTRNISFKEIEIWDEQLTFYGSNIIKDRHEVLLKLIPIAKEIHSQLSGNKESLQVIYKPSLLFKDNPDVNEIRELFKQKLTDTLKEDIRRGYTAIGPHRDDFACFVNEINARIYGSQGQQRTTVLTLKLSMLKLIKEETGEYPILLLDDVFSELDQARREYLLATVTNPIQTIITSTDLSSLESQGIEQNQIFYVSQGKII